MPRKLRELRADLRAAGFAVRHQTGSHETWKNPALAGVKVTLAGKDGADAQPYQEQQVTVALRRWRESQKGV